MSEKAHGRQMRQSRLCYLKYSAHSIDECGAVCFMECFDGNKILLQIYYKNVTILIYLDDFLDNMQVNIQ